MLLGLLYLSSLLALHFIMYEKKVKQKKPGFSGRAGIYLVATR